MEIKTKHRIIGVVVLVALAVIIVPMFLGRSQTAHKSLSSQTSNPTQKDGVQLAAATGDLATQSLQPANDASTNAASNTASQTPATTVAAADQNNSSSGIDNKTTPASSGTPIESLPISVSPRDQGSLQSPVMPEHHKDIVPRTKTGVAKKHYATTESKNKKHEKAVVKHVEKVKHASLAHAWTVQLASFTQKANAEVLVKQLRAKGFAAYIHEASSVKGSVSRVFVGPELKKEKADTMVKKLHEEFHLKGVVVEYKV